MSKLPIDVTDANYQRMLELLQPYVTERRQALIDRVCANRLESIHIALESPHDLHNAAAVVRTAEAFGVLNIHIIAPQDTAATSKGVTQGAFHWVNIHFHEDLATLLQYLAAKNIQLAGACMQGETALAEVSVESPLCLILGNETHGLSEAARAACDLLYHIPMVGMSESLNLSVSAALSMYDTCTRRREFIQAQGDLSTTESGKLTAQYYGKSVNTRLFNQLCKQLYAKD